MENCILLSSILTKLVNFEYSFYNGSGKQIEGGTGVIIPVSLRLKVSTSVRDVKFSQHINNMLHFILTQIYWEYKLFQFSSGMNPQNTFSP